MNDKIDKILKLPKKQKIALLAVILLVEGIALYWGLCMPKQNELKDLQGKLTDLQNQVTETRRIADNLPRLKAEQLELQKQLESALTELPNQKEIPSLLTSITSLGKNAGLDFLLFRPRAEEPKEFYAAVPVDISVSGTYFNLADFFIAVGSLPRIVNISDVNFVEIKSLNGKTMVKVNCLATTFRFLDKKEITDVKK